MVHQSFFMEMETFQIKAKFVEFMLVDASHYVFEDEEQKEWNFGGCDAPNFIFEEELSEDESNSNNSGVDQIKNY